MAVDKGLVINYTLPNLIKAFEGFMKQFTLNDFDFELPQDLIAQIPVAKRDASRLLVVKDGQISDLMFFDIIEEFKEGDVLVFNDTRVIASHLSGYKLNKQGGKTTLSFNLMKQEGNDTWACLVKGAKKLAIDDEIIISGSLKAQVINKALTGEVILKFNLSGEKLFDALEDEGSTPLPPYINGGKEREGDRERYQTVYASKKGAVAAPTAGLHFTEEIIDKLKKKGVNIAFITLHVGGGTFLPVKCNDIKDHKMHSEVLEISKEAAQMINSAKRVFAVGTTSLRTLEGVFAKIGKIDEYKGETDIFITPGYEFKVVDALITNFHLPKSTLLMLVSAFAGFDEMKAAYSHAIKNRYRFFSYGDASLLYLKK